MIYPCKWRVEIIRDGRNYTIVWETNLTSTCNSPQQNVLNLNLNLKQKYRIIAGLVNLISLLPILESCCEIRSFHNIRLSSFCHVFVIIKHEWETRNLKSGDADGGH